MSRLIDPGPSTRGWHHTMTMLQCPEKARAPHWEDHEATVRGSLIHVGLAHHYAIKAGEKGLHAPANAIAALVRKNSHRSELWEELAPQATKVLADYLAHYDYDPCWRVLAVEKELRVQIADPDRATTYLYTQRADLIVENTSSSKVFIVDHKTTNRPIGHKQFTLDGQFIGYELFGKLRYKTRWGGVIPNMIKVSDPAEFRRPKLEPRITDLNSFRRTIIHAERLRHDLERDCPDGPWPRAYHGGACWSYGKPCPFFERCQWGIE